MSEATIKSFRDQPYEEIVLQIVRQFVGDTIPLSELQKLIYQAYSRFDSKDRAPLTQLEENRWLLELYYGPTYAFKDYALQLLARLQDYFLKRRGGKLTILTATSGDTGAAAIEACRGLDAVEIFVLHPYGGISSLHRRLMTTVQDSNVHNIAINGTFDDCQALVKAAFSNRKFFEHYNLSTLNSINWGRIVGQIAYYFSSAAKLGAPEVAPTYSVPTGNFGDVYSGYVAFKMGLPINRLVVATNNNDILHRFFEGEDGVYSRRDVRKTETTPCMNIQAPSNFERVIFDLFDQDAELVRQKMKEFAEVGHFQVDQSIFSHAREIFSSESATEEETRETIRSVYKKYGRIVDPHTAVGIWAAEECKSIKDIDGPIIYLATSHPAKSQDIVKDALKDVPSDVLLPLLNVPERLKEIEDGPERCDLLRADIEELIALMCRKLNVGGRSSVAAE